MIPFLHGIPPCASFGPCSCSVAYRSSLPTRSPPGNRLPSAIAPYGPQETRRQGDHRRIQAGQAGRGRVLRLPAHHRRRPGLLKNLPTLETLDLRVTRIGDGAAAHLKGLTTLKTAEPGRHESRRHGAGATQGADRPGGPRPERDGRHQHGPVPPQGRWPVCARSTSAPPACRTTASLRLKGLDEARRHCA